MKTPTELRLEGKDPARGRGYRKARPNSEDIPCWKCANARKRPVGGRVECIHGAGIIGTLYTCDKAVKV
jgi:hypothetical protein